MIEFWYSLDSFEKILWGIAIPASIVFILQAIMTFMGMDAHDGADADLSGGEDISPFQLFSFRNLINFMLGFSWMGISLYKKIDNTAIIVFISGLAGILLVAIIMYIFYFMSKMEQSGNIQISDTIGLRGTVYIPISAEKKLAGKIQITVKGAVREYDAITEGEALKTGEIIVVKAIMDGNMLLVDKL